MSRLYVIVLVTLTLIAGAAAAPDRVFAGEWSGPLGGPSPGWYGRWYNGGFRGGYDPVRSAAVRLWRPICYGISVPL